MKAEELRIGNIVEFSTPNLPLNIHEMSHVVTVHDILNFTIGKILLTPIPLTEEWLLKSRCEKKSDNIFTIDRFELRWKKAYKYWYVLDAITYNYFTKIEFVHEWQNFYFVLQGTELEMK